MKFFVVVVSALLLSTSCSVASGASNEPDTVVAVGHEQSNAAWTTGSIAVALQRDGSAILTLNFAMPRGRLEMAKLTTRSWSVDISALVKELDRPYPLRTQVWILQINDKGDISDATLTIPFGAEGASCQQLRIRLLDGRIDESSIELASRVQCGQ